ncbi:unnamed protein product [Gadus morhua 'NCC']
MESMELISAEQTAFLQCKANAETQLHRRRPPLTPPASTRLHPLSVRASSVTLSPSVSPRSPARLTDASQNWERDDGVEWRTVNVPRRWLQCNTYTAIAGRTPGAVNHQRGGPALHHRPTPCIPQHNRDRE